MTHSELKKLRDDHLWTADDHRALLEHVEELEEDLRAVSANANSYAKELTAALAQVEQLRGALKDIQNGDCETITDQPCGECQQCIITAALAATAPELATNSKGSKSSAPATIEPIATIEPKAPERRWTFEEVCAALDTCESGHAPPDNGVPCDFKSLKATLLRNRAKPLGDPERRWTRAEIEHAFDTTEDFRTFDEFWSAFEGGKPAVKSLGWAEQVIQSASAAAFTSVKEGHNAAQVAQQVEQAIRNVLSGAGAE